MSDPARPRGETSVRSVLDRLRAKRESALPTRIPRLARNGGAYPLSDGQERLWFIDRMLPGNAAYNIAAAVEMAGPLDLAAFAAALTEIVRRHETLRTSFHAAGGQPVQVISPVAGSPLYLVDLGGLVDGGRIADRLAGELAVAPFDLAGGALLRVGLLRLGPEEHRLVLVLHHIVSDGWSLRIVLRETRLLYQAFLERRPSPLPELTVQYVDFVDWQRGWLAGDTAARQLAYWKQELGERPTVLQLPADRPRPAVQSLRGRSLPMVLPPGLSAEIGALTRSAEVTPFITLLAGFQALLHRLTGQPEILTGFPIANRKRPEIQDLIGFFVNTLVLGARFSAGLRFRDLLRSTHESALGAHANQELPFGRLVKELQPARQTSHSPLVQVAFAYQNLEAASWNLPGLRLTPRDVPRASAMFDLRLDLKEEPLGFAGEIEYSTDLFDAATVSRWAGYLATLLAASVADPERRVVDLPLLSAAEAQQLREANDTTVRFAAGTRCLHEIIAEQAAGTPDAIAIAAEEGVLSYREMAARSEQLARQLALLGIGPDVRVGICLERSRELMVGLLAVLTAGGAYVPFDPSYPRERLAYMLADSAVPVLLAQQATLSALPNLEAAGVRVILLDGASAACAGPGTAGAPVVHLESLAYVIYTSGSTGRPKGVMNTHAGIVNRLLWMQAQYGLTPGDRVLQKTPVSFDVSVWELFWPLLTGACLVMARPGGHQDGAYLVRTIAEQEITTLHFVPSMLAVFLETPGVERSAGLRRVMASGEALSPALAERYFSRLKAPLHNLYGPTETAVDVTFWPCDPADRRGLVPIGWPVANTVIHLLDRDLRPAPLGVAGELHIGGVQLARGYLGRPELTAERFVPDPSGDGARLYATGDLARRLPGGEIDYLGRLDHQVKIRGFRIELGEIETVLGRDPEVVEAVVVAELGRPGESARLVAYVVPAGSGQDPELWTAGLRRRLRDKLPEHMVPAVFVALEALPLTPSGKVDRRSLPAPERGTRDGDERTFVPPRNPTEEILAAIWTEVLGIERCGVEDDFFALGGHSLLANQVVSRIRGLLGIELPLHSFFSLPTVAALAERVEAARRGDSPALPPLTAGERSGDEPLSFAQQRLWFLSQLDPESTAYHVAVALRLTGALSPPALAAALAFMVEHHETLRTTFALRPDGPVQVVAPPSGWRLPVVDLASLGEAKREAEMHRLAQAEANRPFDLARGPLLRTLLVRLAEQEHVLSLLLHHIVSDGWSMGVLWQETMALYSAAVAGKPPRLPPLPIQYRDFAAWQRRWLTGETLERELDFWRRQLAGAPTLLELPADRARPPVQRFRGRRLPFALPAVQTAGLKRLGQREGATLFMALLAAFDALLHRYSRQNDLVVGFPIAGRRPETEGLIGLFLNTLALRVEVEGGAGWLALLRRVRDVALDAFAHQDLPFEKLVAELDLERNLAHAPLFQTLLAFQNTPAAVADLPGLAIQPLEIGTGTAKFDLVLNLEDTPSGLAGWLIYNRDLFDPSTMARMRTHLTELITSLLAAPERQVDELALLGPAERHQLLAAWNDTAVPGTEISFVAGFSAQAARTPDAIALACGDLQTSYGELDLRSTRLARGLATRAVGPESQVAVLSERGSDLLSAMLALWKLGAAYLPLDPHHPTARLAQTLAQSGSPLVLAADPHRAAAAAVATAERPAVTIGDLLGDGRMAGNLPALPPPGPAGLAYVLFTSGSTGVPKGAMIEHLGMANHLAAMIADLELTASDRVAQTAPQTFDISIWQLLAALLVGATVDILPDEVIRDPLTLLAEIERRGLTVFEPVPSLLAALLQVEPGRRPALAALRWVLPTGEALSPELCRQWFAAYPAVPLVNAYGPAECSDDVTLQILRRPPPTGAARTPIGRPVANTRVYVLGPGEEPAPIGVPGELAVAGVQVGRAYWGRPDLTADRFVPDPFSALPGGRLYRTGDLARLRPAGEVEFLGRIDHQVKVRGFRIELGDIEAALATHPAVREAVVLARADREEQGGAVDRRLVAYLVAAEGSDLALPELREQLQRRLPEYMVPSAFVVLAAMPLNANGKVDRKALPAPEAGGFAASRERVAPRSDLERHLASLWAGSLGLAATEVGIDDSYFDLGGNSILGAVLVNRLQKTLGEIVHVVALFDHSTVATMASYLARDYPAAVARLWGEAAETESASSARLDREAVAAFRALLPALESAEPPAQRNPSAVFLLSAPRSGSTLLRIMLGGNPGLFAPPELELLSFHTMAERRAALSGRNAFWLEGLIRAVMEIRRMSPEQARALVEHDEARALPTRLVYRRLQEWIGERILVDKTTTYALGEDILARAEADFDRARYIHLVRDPRAAIRSFVEAKLDQVFFRHSHPFTRRELAELIWVVSHQNIGRFLAAIPQERQCFVRFEELVHNPAATLARLCDFLGLPFHPDTVQPYKDVHTRMADGLHTESRMLGDVKFHQHSRVEASVADRWRADPAGPLGPPARELAAELGYEIPLAQEVVEEARPAGTRTAVPPLVPADRSRPLPLSFAQQRLWFLDQLSPGGSVYNIPSSVRLVGRLDVPAFAASLGEVVRRHEMMRTTFGEEAGEPVQRIAASGPIALPVVDLRDLPAPARELEAHSLASAEAERAFDLARGPLLRSHLVALSGEEQVILLTMHHIISDGWSKGVLVQELASLYEAFSQGRPSPLPELLIQYADFACWQRQWLAGEVLNAEIAYWRERLAGASPRLELPTDRPRPAVQTFAGAHCAVSIPGPLVAELKAVARSQDATLFMALLAAFQALLCRYSGQTDLSVGTPSAGRNHFQTEELIGFFINTLVLRTELSEGPTFSGLTARVRETALAAYLHQDLPFEMLVEQLRPERSLSHSPLFQVMLVLQNAPQRALTVPGLQLEPFEVPGTTAKFDLTLTLVEAPSGLLGTLSYNRDLFEETTVQRLARSWTRLIQSAVAEPESRVLEVPLLAPAERHQLVVDWNDTASRSPLEASFLHRWIEAQAARTPEAAAVRFEGRELTYADLNAWANRLARHLQDLGVGPDRGVGICAKRSLELCVGLLAILKAGGAYVPLDPSLPAERLAFMVEDVASSLGMPVLLTQSRLLEQAALWAVPGTAVVLLDGAPGAMASDDGNLEGAPATDNLAYLIYTSGSTGRPKAVMVPHRGLLNYLLWSAEAYGASAGTGSLVHSALSFDLTVTSLLVPLLGGRTVQLVSEGDGVEELAAALLASRDLTLLKLTPAHLEALRGYLPAEEVPGRVRMLVIGGEALQGEALGFWFEQVPGTRLINEYGPTETVVGCCVYEVPPGRSTCGPVPIGRPVANTHVVLLDRWLELPPLGAIGELYIGGAGVTRGYLGLPELTAEKFVPDAFDESPGARLYRTGDLARYLPDGRLQYLGRTDHQVKIRGFRIELGEIEATLASHPAVREAVVLARDDRKDGDRRLVAYAVAEEEAGLAVAELRAFLRGLLPEYMLPAAFVFLPALPLTPNGKVDRKALPAPESGPGEEWELLPPRNPVEEVLASIWTEVLAIETVGVRDNFFELGGHSLLANQVVSRIRDTLQVELTLRSFFAGPTIEALANGIATAHRSEASAPLERRARSGEEPLSFAQQRLWFLHQLDPESTAYHIPAALHLEGAFDPAVLTWALGQVAERQEMLRTTFHLHPDGPVQVIAPPAPWPLPVLDLSGLGEGTRQAEMRHWTAAEIDRRFDLGRGPLLRTTLFRLAEREHVLLLVLHHVISDAWSTAILARETLAFYRAAVEGRPAGLSELPVQYGDYAAWQREWLSGVTLENELAYWREQLAGAPALLELPTDRPRPAVQRFQGGRVRLALPAEDSRRLKQLGHRTGATLFMALLAAFDTLLYRYSRHADLVVGFPIAGRNRVETEGLIGLFLNTLALRVQVDPEASWRDLLTQVREVTLAAYLHQELPFEKLVAELDLERNLAHAPLFQTLVVLQNTPAAPTDVPGILVEPLEVGTATAKFDLVLNVEETPSGLTGWLIYNRALFDPATVARIRAHLGELVTSLLAAPERRVDELALLGPAERHQLLAAWNDTAVPGTEITFVALFTAQAARAPDAVALAWGDLQISYGELDRRSARLARGLAARSVGPEAQVAVLTERGGDLLTAMIALWKLGAAYLPLDPHHPTARLAQTLAQSGSRLVLGTERPAVTIGDLLEDGGTAGTLPAPPGPAGLAYVLFTSGSTGVPKGAMVEHRGMANHLAAKIADLGLTASDRVAQTAVQTFDISIWQFLAALVAGGSVEVLPDEVVRDPLSLLAEIERRGLTVFETVPSLLAALLQVEPGRRPDLAALRWVIPTGEALSPELCRQWFAAYPAIPLVNAYGPTECSDDVTHQILRAAPEGAARTPIGRPVVNTRVYALGPGREPAPIGVPGELAVAGAQVGRGYWGRPDLTADRFVPDPFSALPGGRLYRTGDLARLRPSGEVEFLGRIDHQVKVRGFRIELGDIEAALAAHPAVREAVVLAREDRKDGDRRLVAYVVAEAESDLALPELREWLSRQLPEYMVPSAFVVLEALPLTANGKIDRKALPAPEAGGLAASRERVAPRTDLERHLAGLWAESLGLAATEVGVDDSYFDLGGNSILGAVLVNRLQKTLGEIVHVVSLFDHPTVAAMASYLARDYPAAVARLWGETAETRGAAGTRVDREAVAAFRALLPAPGPAETPAERNPPAVFLLSAPRSGSTLLRIMLGGNPGLFAPPELELLSFDTMAERRDALSGRHAFWLEGLIRAVMEIRRTSPEEARALIEDGEARALPTRLVYRRLQEWIGERLLVDKTSTYALGQDILARAEADFDRARYIHLVRDPRAAIRSFEEARLDQVFFRHPHPFTRRELAELIWVVSHQNIVRFLTAVPAERQCFVRFEDLVRDPGSTLARICDFLGLPFHADMVQPYKDVHTRMADGLHAESRMLGDVKFLQHSRVEASVADRWRAEPAVPIGPPARELAAELGYEIPIAEEALRGSAPSHPALVPLQTGGLRTPLFLVHPVGGSVFWYLGLARQLGTEQPVYGLRATVDPGAAPPGLPAMARRYLDAVREVQPAGPYRLGGWSMGAVVAFEMARQLRADGGEVALLALIDPPPPSRAAVLEEDELTLLASLVRDLEGLSGRNLGLAREDVERLGGDERLACVLSRSQAAGALPTELGLDDFRAAFAVFRQNRNAVRTYVPGPYPGRITLFRAQDTLAADPAGGWVELAEGGITTHLLAGNHYSILRTPADELGERLRSALVHMAG